MRPSTNLLKGLADAWRRYRRTRRTQPPDTPDTPEDGTSPGNPEGSAALGKDS
ncbi:hypothetical protein ACWEHT_20525 [Streptomyces sp. NPDC004646]